MLNKLGGRKFIYAIMSVIMAFALVINGTIEPSMFLDFVKIIGGMYVLGNVMKAVVEK